MGRKSEKYSLLKAFKVHMTLRINKGGENIQQRISRCVPTNQGLANQFYLRTEKYWEYFEEIPRSLR